MTVLGDVDGALLLPAEEEEATGAAEYDGQAQPRVVRHEDEHEKVGHKVLQSVQEGLEQVEGGEHGPAPALVEVGVLVECQSAGVPGGLQGRVPRVPPVQVVPVVLEALVQEGEDEDDEPRVRHASVVGHLPEVEHDHLHGAAVEPHFHHHVAPATPAHVHRGAHVHGHGGRVHVHGGWRRGPCVGRCGRVPERLSADRRC